MSKLLLDELEKIKRGVEEMRPEIETGKLAAASPISSSPASNHGHETAAGGGWQAGSLLAQIDYWKDRCMAAEQALDATIKQYEDDNNQLRYEYEGKW